MSCRVFYPLVLLVPVLAIPKPEPDDVHIHLHALDKIGSATRGIESEPEPEPESEPEPEPEPACSPATRCKVGRQGDRACGPNSRCDRKHRVCVCNSPAQEYPNCCWPSCRGMDAVCVKGGPCQCIGNGKYPDCQEVCGEWMLCVSREVPANVLETESIQIARKCVVKDVETEKFVKRLEIWPSVCVKAILLEEEGSANLVPKNLELP